MILTRLAGGLGNQMFHYATARAAQRSDAEPIVLDTRLLRDLESDIERITQRPYALDVFKNLKARPIGPSLCRLFEGNDFVSRLRRKVFNRRATYVDQQFLESVELPTDPKRHIFLRGNFQSEQYFVGIRDQLLTEFEFPPLDATNRAIEQRMAEVADPVAVHIRRGDYLSSLNRDTFTSVTLGYYVRAIEQLTARLGRSSIAAFVFTDDIDWVRANVDFGSLAVSFVEGNHGHDSWKDMCLMTHCQHHIIANSSFSWWGAWLAKRAGLKFAPQHWFRPNTYPFDIDQIVPAGWTVVDYPLQDEADLTRQRA